MEKIQQGSWVCDIKNHARIGQVREELPSLFHYGFSVHWNEDPVNSTRYADVKDVKLIETQRHIQGSPRCGDVWKFKNGRYLLVDYKDGMQTSFTFNDGQAKSHGYTMGYSDMLKDNDATLILRSEESGFPACNEGGWTRKEDVWSIKQSLEFLNGVIARNGKGETAPCALNYYNVGFEV